MNSQSRSALLTSVLVLCLAVGTLPGQGNKTPSAGKKASSNSTAKKLPIKLVVLVPESAFGVKTKLWLFDSLMDASGNRREFTTQPLATGKKYYYDLKVLSKPNNYTTITRRLRVRNMLPGKTYTVDLMKPNPKFPDDIKIRWVPTPKAVVDKMLKLAKAGKNDVVYDLGCGDGIIVITAVKEFGVKRGVGVEIDPKKVIEAKAAAKKAGVADKVEFREGDVLKKLGDLEQASVVTLYMALEINLRLKPILRKRLKPGSRVVSHRFLMGDDWPPEKTITHTNSKGEKYLIHLWTIRAHDTKKSIKKSERKKSTKGKP